MSLWKKREPQPVVPVFEPARERLLCAGAILAARSGCEPHRLVEENPKYAAKAQKSAVKALAGPWGVRTAEELRATVQQLLLAGQHPQVDPFFRSLRDAALSDPSGRAVVDVFNAHVAPRMQADAARGQYFNNLQATYKEITKKLRRPDGAKLSYLELYALVSTVRAWDLERAAWVGRLGFMAGLVSEEEAFSILHATREQIERTYPSWRDYGIAFVVGRADCFDDGESFLVVGDLADELDNPYSLFNRYPIGSR